MKMTNNLRVFETGNPGFAELKNGFMNYYNRFQSERRKMDVSFCAEDAEGNKLSFAEMEKAVNEKLKEQIVTMSQKPTDLGFTDIQWANEPSVKYATFAIVNQLVDMVLPDTVIKSIGMFTEVRNSGFGDNFVFDIKSNDLFVVSKSSMGKRHGVTEQLQ